MSINDLKIERANFIGFLVALYFILGFFWISYAANTYVVASLFLYVILFFGRFNFSLIISTIVFLISLFYLYMSGMGEAYRFLKTFLVFFPVAYVCRYYNLSNSKLLDAFLKFSVFLVFLEFIFYSFFGFGFIPDTTTTRAAGAEFLRYRSFFEDSNFFSYTILTYIFYKKIVFGRYDIFFVGALFLSLSVSAIIAFISLVSFYSVFNPVGFLKRYYRFIFGVLILVVTCFYIFLVFNFFDLIGTVDSEFWRFKLVSLSIRFDVQAAAINYIFANDSSIWGDGAGAARLMNDGGYNLHNTYLQIFVEMGFFTLLFVLFFLTYMFYRIDVRFLPVYSLLVLLGLIMEVYYFPLLVFVFYLSHLKNRQV